MTRAGRILARDKVALAGCVLIVVIAAAAVAAPWIAPQDPRAQDVTETLRSPTRVHILGTDDFGRDTLSRVIWGARPSLLVGVASVVAAMAVGMTVGVTAGYHGGAYDLVVMRLADGLLAFPSLLLGLLVVAILGPGLENTIIAVALSLVPQFARLARAATIAVRETAYVEWCHSSGATRVRILVRHIVPNTVGPIVVMGTLWISTAIRTEASLSFLGLGIQPPTPSWGTMIKAGVDQIGLSPWLAIFPGLAIMLSVFAFNMVGDGLRDILDPKSRGR